MSKLNILKLLLLVILQGCISSRHDVRVACNDNIRNATLLVPAIMGLSPRQAEKLFKIMDEELRQSGIQLLYHPREEWTLASKGIVKGDAAFMSKLKDQNIPFLLIIDLQDSQTGESLDYKTAEQVRSRFGPPVNGYVPPEGAVATKSVSLRFSIISTATYRSVYSAVTKTNISPIAIRDRNDGEWEVNAGSEGLALQKAMKKGIRHLKGKCLPSL